MYAVEFETQVHNQAIILPDSIPEGAEIRVLILMKDQQPIQAVSDVAPKPDLKKLLMSLTEGLSEELDEIVRHRANDLPRDVVL